jgi:hypothetical protein
VWLAKKGIVAMWNFFLLILWPILIGGCYFSYKIGEDRWGRKGALLLPVAFTGVYFFTLWAILGKYWWQSMFHIYLAL